MIRRAFSDLLAIEGHYRPSSSNSHCQFVTGRAPYEETVPHVMVVGHVHSGNRDLTFFAAVRAHNCDDAFHPIEGDPFAVWRPYRGGKHQSPSRGAGGPVVFVLRDDLRTKRLPVHDNHLSKKIRSLRFRHVNDPIDVAVDHL